MFAEQWIMERKRTMSKDPGVESQERRGLESGSGQGKETGIMVKRENRERRANETE